MSYYNKHVFFCCNQRKDGEICCNSSGGSQAQIYAKKRTDELKIKGKGMVRVSSSGCLGRCGEGPVMVVYPEEIWYHYGSLEDVEEIIQEHLVHGKIVERLKV